ncbi:MAG TPA: cytochrome c-type biogenesis CcmF C-terminal domain-containing protein, partial [Terriglobales bacterium]|nr:cytochrome c-type biogenesis CcmF C-terminal domain-containing protein [Terriglobales bacterium]
VTATIVQEFYKGASVIARKQSTNLISAAWELTMRNTRRYGGYVVHYGVALVMIGLAGSAFNRDKEMEMGYGDHMNVGPYTLTCRSYTQDDKPNYRSEWAILDVTDNGKPLTTMYPERRFYRASQQMATMVANRSTLKEDLYVVYEGVNEDTGRPIIKVHLNPLVMWIWIGWLTMVGGTLLCMVPNAARVPLPAAAPLHATAAAEAGD